MKSEKEKGMTILVGLSLASPLLESAHPILLTPDFDQIQSQKVMDSKEVQKEPRDRREPVFF
jgi:hypothetical protein